MADKPQSLADFLGTVPAHEDVPDDLLPEPLTAEAFALRILNSQEYRDSLNRRIILDELAPAVEIRLYDLAYGKPTDRVEVKDTTNDLRALTEEQLRDRALAIAREQAQHLHIRMHEDTDDSVH